jgi:lipoate-protein ligase A
MLSGSFYSTFSRNPYFNMAQDEWMFCRAIHSPGLILLRLYSWDSEAITFGYNQNENKVVDRSRLNGIPLIRRVTGGRALLHEPSELTYSIAVNSAGLNSGPLNGSVSESSRSISLALLEFLKAIDIRAHYVRQSAPGFTSRNTFHNQPCFESFARNEILTERGKIIASAQRRIGDCFLQHGSIKFNGVAGHPALNSSRNNSLDSSQIRRLSEFEFQKYAELFRDSIGRSLGISLKAGEISELDAKELAGFELLVRKKSIFRRDPIKQNEESNSLLIDSHY